MAVEELQPLQPVEPYPKYRYQAVTLGGVDYDYRINWNDRTEAWYLYWQRSDGSTPPVLGAKLVSGWSLLLRYTGRGPAGGLLILVDLGGGDAADRPTYEGLGHRWILTWTDDEDIPATDPTPVYTVTVP